MKKLLFLFILNLISFQIFSCQVITTPFKIAQPNGDSIIIVQRMNMAVGTILLMGMLSEKIHQTFGYM